MIPFSRGSDNLFPSESRERSLMAAEASPPPTAAWEMALKMLGTSGAEPAAGVPPKLDWGGKPGEVGNLASARKGSLGRTPGKPNSASRLPRLEAMYPG